MHLEGKTFLFTRGSFNEGLCFNYSTSWIYFFVGGRKRAIVLFFFLGADGGGVM